jgi:polysaccharide biosynthesis protein PslJ
MFRILGRAELILFNPDRRISALALGGLVVLGAFVAALLVAVAGPVYAVAALLVVCGGLLVLRDIRWGFVALFAVVGLLPFAALPFKLGFTPTFLDVALLALFFVWLIRVATRREPRLVGSALGVPLLIFFFLVVFAFANGLRFSRPTATTIRNFSELALGILFFFLIVNTLRSEADLFFVARLIMVAGAGAAFVAIIFSCSRRPGPCAYSMVWPDSTTPGAPAPCGTSRTIPKTRCEPLGLWLTPTYSAAS